MRTWERQGLPYGLTHLICITGIACTSHEWHACDVPDTTLHAESVSSCNLLITLGGHVSLFYDSTDEHTKALRCLS